MRKISFLAIILSLLLILSCACTPSANSGESGSEIGGNQSSSDIGGETQDSSSGGQGSSDSSSVEDSSDVPDPDPTCTLRLVYNNGTADELISVTPGESISQPTTPTYDDNLFLGWYSKGEIYDWSSAVTEDITVQALWQMVYDDVSLNKTVSGGFTNLYGQYLSTSANSMIVCEDANFTEGTIEVTICAGVSSDNGLVLCLSGKGNSYWESGVSYYFFFINIEGYAYLGRVNDGNWGVLKTVLIPNYQLGKNYTLKAVLSGTEICCFVDNELYIVFSEYNFLPGRGVGLRAGGVSTSYSNFRMSGICEY